MHERKIASSSSSSSSSLSSPLSSSFIYLLAWLVVITLQSFLSPLSLSLSSLSFFFSLYSIVDNEQDIWPDGLDVWIFYSDIMDNGHFPYSYNVLLLVFKCFVGIGPSYLNELLSMKMYSRYNKRYFKDPLWLSKPEMNLKTMGDRVFSAYGPVQWNKLPLSLRSLSSMEIKDGKTIKRQ